jgi:hypothetical protein
MHSCENTSRKDRSWPNFRPNSASSSNRALGQATRFGATGSSFRGACVWEEAMLSGRMLQRTPNASSGGWERAKLSEYPTLYLMEEGQEARSPIQLFYGEGQGESPTWGGGGSGEHTEYFSESGIKRMRSSTERQCDRRPIDGHLCLRATLQVGPASLYMPAGPLSPLSRRLAPQPTAARSERTACDHRSILPRSAPRRKRGIS